MKRLYLIFAFLLGVPTFCLGGAPEEVDRATMRDSSPTNNSVRDTSTKIKDLMVLDEEDHFKVKCQLWKQAENGTRQCVESFTGDLDLSSMESDEDIVFKWCGDDAESDHKLAFLKDLMCYEDVRLDEILKQVNTLCKRRMREHAPDADDCDIDVQICLVVGNGLIHINSQHLEILELRSFGPFVQISGNLSNLKRIILCKGWEQILFMTPLWRNTFKIPSSCQIKSFGGLPYLPRQSAQPENFCLDPCKGIDISYPMYAYAGQEFAQDAFKERVDTDPKIQQHLSRCPDFLIESNIGFFVAGQNPWCLKFIAPYECRVKCSDYTLSPNESEKNDPNNPQSAFEKLPDDRVVEGCDALNLPSKINLIKKFPCAAARIMATMNHDLVFTGFFRPSIFDYLNEDIIYQEGLENTENPIWTFQANNPDSQVPQTEAFSIEGKIDSFFYEDCGEDEDIKSRGQNIKYFYVSFWDVDSETGERNSDQPLWTCGPVFQKGSEFRGCHTKIELKRSLYLTAWHQSIKALSEGTLVLKDRYHSLYCSENKTDVYPTFEAGVLQVSLNPCPPHVGPDVWALAALKKSWLGIITQDFGLKIEAHIQHLLHSSSPSRKIRVEDFRDGSKKSWHIDVNPKLFDFRSIKAFCTSLKHVVADIFGDVSSFLDGVWIGSDHFPDNLPPLNGSIDYLFLEHLQLPPQWCFQDVFRMEIFDTSQQFYSDALQRIAPKAGQKIELFLSNAPSVHPLFKKEFFQIKTKSSIVVRLAGLHQGWCHLKDAHPKAHPGIWNLCFFRPEQLSDERKNFSVRAFVHTDRLNQIRFANKEAAHSSAASPSYDKSMPAAYTPEFDELMRSLFESCHLVIHSDPVFKTAEGKRNYEEWYKRITKHPSKKYMLVYGDNESEYCYADQERESTQDQVPVLIMRFGLPYLAVDPKNQKNFPQTRAMLHKIYSDVAFQRLAITWRTPQGEELAGLVPLFLGDLENSFDFFCTMTYTNVRRIKALFNHLLIDALRDDFDVDKQKSLPKTSSSDQTAP